MAAADSPIATAVSLEAFRATYDAREDGYKYEWIDGVVEKSPAMNQEQAFIQSVLQRLFTQTTVYAAGGLLAAETDMFTSPQQLRKPDLAIYTAEQLADMREGKYQVPQWVAELISPTDNFNKVVAKVVEYLKAGVTVVWLIIPATSQVYVYTDAASAKVCDGDDLCSAAPAFSDFELPAESLFA